LTAADPRRAWLVVLAALGVFFAADDQTSVVALLPPMIGDIGLAQDEFYRAAWIINAYILGYVVAMPLMGRVSDVYGHGRIFALSLAVFVVGSAWVASSSDLPMVSFARGFQAVGGGAVVPIAMAIVADTLAPSRRALGLGLIAAASEAGGLVGPLWGGGIADLVGWRWVFWINVPMCLPLAFAVLLLGRRLGAPERRSLDVAGAALLGASLVCLTIALTNDPIEPRSGGATAALYAGAAALFALFLLRQSRAREPVVRLLHFRKAPLSAGFLSNALVGGALIVAMVNVPLFTNIVLRDSALAGGLNLMRMTIALPVGAVAGGLLATALGFQRTAVLGLGLIGLGFLGLARWDASPGFLAMTLPLLVAGLGFGVVIAPIGTAVVNQVEEGERATISSLLTVVRLLGMLVGVALLTTRGLGSFYAEAGLIPLDDPRFAELLRAVQVDTFRETFLFTGFIAFATALPALFLGTGERRRVGPRDLWPFR
jgi:MFS family permease